MAENALYYGDNLETLRRYIPDESVDLIYLDPPFNSNQDYNVLFADKSGKQSEAQIKAFEDTWQWDRAAALAYQETVEAGGDVLPWGKHPKVQILTIAELLEGRTIDSPRGGVNLTFKQAPKHKRTQDQPDLPLAADPQEQYE